MYMQSKFSSEFSPTTHIDIFFGLLLLLILVVHLLVLLLFLFLVMFDEFIQKATECVDPHRHGERSIGPLQFHLGLQGQGELGQQISVWQMNLSFLSKKNLLFIFLLRFVNYEKINFHVLNSISTNNYSDF